MAERMAGALDYWERREGIQQARAEMRRRLAAAPGQVIADVGCGTGTELAAVASSVVPGGRAIGIDPSVPMLDVARTRLSGLEGVELVEASGFDTGLEAESCDGVRIERIVQHTGRINDLLGEAHRIIRPGGLVVIADTDWGSLMLHPGDRTYVRGFKARWETGPMAEPWAGRTLAGGLLDAGFVDVNSTGFFVATDVGVIDAMAGPMEAAFTAGRGRRDEWEDFTSELREAFERGSGVWAFVMFVAWGRRPGASAERSPVSEDARRP